MPIIGPLPNQIQNGQVEDANPVMADYNYIVSQVNANACPATTAITVLKGDGLGGTTAAIPGTDYATPAQIPSINTNFTQGGTGAVTVTMQNKVRGVSVNVTDFGAVFDGTTDISPMIQLGVNYLESIGGGFLDFPQSTLRGILRSTVTISSSDIKLRGQGHGGNHDNSDGALAATFLQWDGVAGGTAFYFAPKPTAISKLFGCGMTGIFLYAGTTVANYGVNIATCNGGIWDIAGNGFAQALMVMGCLELNGFLQDAYDSQDNDVSLRSYNVFNGGGCLVCQGRSDGIANVSLNTFRSIRANVSTGTAVNLLDCDSNLFMSVSVFGVGVAGAEPTGYGLRLHGSSTSAGPCRQNLFQIVAIAAFSTSGEWARGVVAHGTESYTVPSGVNPGPFMDPNVIQFYDWLDTRSPPFIGTAALLHWASNRAPMGMQKVIKGAGAGMGLRVASDGWAVQHGVDFVPNGGSTIINLPHALSAPDASIVTVCPVGVITTGFFVDNLVTTSLVIHNTGATGGFFAWSVSGYVTLTAADWNF